MTTGLVLGGGGVVGMAYHAGALRALEEVGGLQPDAVDLIVGTSAGSVVGAYLRSGWSTDDFWQLALGTHPKLGEIGVGDPGDRDHQVIARAFRTPLGFARRGLGAAFVMASSISRFPLGPMPALLRNAFPGALFDMPEGRRRFAEELPSAWPDKDLWLVAVDITRGRRVVLGRPGAPEATLQQAVRASAAIPGVYAPVPLGRMTLVDGGVRSPTNLDLATSYGCGLIIAVAPMAYDTGARPGTFARMARELPTRMLARETAGARRAGAEVLLVRPDAAEVALHGLNLMRPEIAAAVARAAYDSTARTIDTPRFRDALASAAAARPPAA